MYCMLKRLLIVVKYGGEERESIAVSNCQKEEKIMPEIVRRENKLHNFSSFSFLMISSSSWVKNFSEKWVREKKATTTITQKSRKAWNNFPFHVLAHFFVTDSSFVWFIVWRKSEEKWAKFIHFLQTSVNVWEKFLELLFFAAAATVETRLLAKCEVIQKAGVKFISISPARERERARADVSKQTRLLIRLLLC